MNVLPSVEQIRSRPWLLDMKIHGERFGDALERTPRFRFEGDGPLSTREIVPETVAAARALSGEHGAKLKHALHEWLGTFDAMSGVTRLESVGFSLDGNTAAVNDVIGGASWPGMTDALPEEPNSREKWRIRAGIEEMADSKGPGMWGISYRSMNIGPAASNLFFGAVSGAPSNEYLDPAVHVLVHELAHRMSEPPIELGQDMDPNDPADMATASLMQLLSEGSADLITSLPGLKNDARERMGLPAVAEQPFQSGYDGFVGALTEMLHQAALDPRAPEHREQIIELLERPDMLEVPDAIASLIVERQGIDWARQDEVASAIRNIGEHGIEMVDNDTYDAASKEIATRTDAAVDLIGRYAQEARTQRERADER